MAKNKRNNKELMKLFEGKVTETQIYKKPILYQELRAKLLSSTPETFTVNVNEFKQQLSKQFVMKTIHKRRPQIAECSRKVLNL